MEWTAWSRSHGVVEAQNKILSQETERTTCLNSLGLMILGNEFYLAVLKDCLLDFPSI